MTHRKGNMHNIITTGSIDGKQCALLQVNTEIYSLQTIYAAGYTFLDRAYILIDKGKNNKILNVMIFNKNNGDVQKLGMEFYNELINYAHYFSRVEGNAGIIKTIMQRVLFSVNPKFSEEAEEQEIQDLLKELEKETPKKSAKS